MKTKYIIHKTDVYGKVSAESHDEREVADNHFTELAKDKNYLFVRVVSRMVINEHQKRTEDLV